MQLPPTTQAWTVRAYGGPEVLELQELPLRAPGPGEVLIEVRATTVSSGDRRVRALDLPAGFGVLGRFALGFRRPRRAVLGTELAGVVVAVGERCRQFGVGDAVIAFTGVRMGAHARHVVLPMGAIIVPKPERITFESAAALCFGGTTALHFLRRARLRAGERVLVVGACGTVGSAMIQIARQMGAEVTAVTGVDKHDLARDLGAAVVIDAAGFDPAAQRPGYDVVADTYAGRFRQFAPLLAEHGRYLAIAAGLRDMFARPLGSRRSIAGMAAERIEDVVELAALARAGEFHPLVDSVFAFADLPGAHARVDAGCKRGSVVVSMAPSAGGSAHQ